MTDEHKRSNKTRRNMLARHARHVEQRRRPEDHKRLKEQSRRRKAERGESAPRRRDWDVHDDDLRLVEPMRPSTSPQPTHRGPPHRDPPPDPSAGSDPTTPSAPPAAARVLSLAPGRAVVADADGVHDARLVGALAETQQTSVAVGDLVHTERRADGRWLTGVLPRRTTLSRPDPGNPHRRRVLAANIDVAVLVLSVARPRFKPGLVDRFLIALDGSGARAVVVANKLDLLDEPGQRAAIAERLAPYPALGVPVIGASAETGEGLAELRAALAGRSAVFVGHSGVGKSSLLNGLDPDGRRRTHAGRGGDGKGRHTTTRSTLTELPDGTAVIDTPGVRAFGLWGLSPAALRAAFPDLDEHAAGCRFRDCSHVVEPGCAVRAAVAAGALPDARLQAYARILASLEG